MDYLESNFTLIIIVWIVTAFLYQIGHRIQSKVLKRVFRVSIVFLVLPAAYFGHPLLVYQVWMLIFAYVTQGSFGALAISGSVWLVLVLVSLIHLATKQHNKPLKQDK
jgi:hypothetical protein